MKRKYYDILEISKNATADDVKKAYRKQAMQFHPDRAPADKRAEYEEKFKESSEAYSVLSDEVKRKRYDSPDSPAADGPSGVESFWRANRNVQKGTQVNIALPVTLEEAFDSPTKVIRYEREAACMPCGATGLAPGKKSIPCPYCKTKGWVEITMHGMRVPQPCMICLGKGSSIQQQDRCTTCGGASRMKKETLLNVQVPHGVLNGQAVSYESMGNASLSGGPSGDACVFFKVLPHKSFERLNADDLMTEVNIDFVHLVLGGKLDVKSLKGSLDVVVPPLTKSGALLRVAGHGFKNTRTQNTGSLFVKLVGQTPMDLTPRQVELLNEFATIERTKGEGHHDGKTIPVTKH